MSWAQSSVLVFLGGGLGANARYWLGTWIAGRWGAVFPWHTALINISGSLIIGVFMSLMLKLDWNPGWRLFFAIGVLGGYTTFSSFSYETVDLVQRGSNVLALGYLSMNLFLSVLGCWAGIVIGRVIGGAS